LLHVFEGSPAAEWRAHRIRSVLQFVFEKHFEFVFEALRRKTLELAAKQLAKIRDLSPFVRNYTLHEALGTHVVPVDRSMTNACIWLGLVGAGETPEHAAETLKSTVRKADVAAFCHLLRSLAVDPRLIKAFDSGKQSSQQHGDPQTMIERLEVLFKEGDAAAKKSGKKALSGRGASARRSDGHDHSSSGSKLSRGSGSRGLSPARKKK
jgi:hypothetical protein